LRFDWTQGPEIVLSERLKLSVWNLSI